jgi:hypothetical protein
MWLAETMKQHMIKDRDNFDPDKVQNDIKFHLA